MMKPVRTILAAALALAAAPAFAQAGAESHDNPYSQTVFFGDSLTDSGHFRPTLIAIAGPDAALVGKFTTNPWLVWSEYLAEFYGTDASPANQGGDNYAVGGARSGTDVVGELGPTPSMATQVTNYLTATSGVAINSLVEQGSTVLAEPNDNFRYARRIVGQQLLALIKQDMLGNVTAVAVKRGASQKTVYFNRSMITDAGPVVENDIATAQVKVVLEDIPATPSFRAQQLRSFSQIVQSAPPAYQAVLYPAMLELSDVSNRHELADQLRKVGSVDAADPRTRLMREQFQVAMQQQQLAMAGLREQLVKAQQALADKSRELDLKERNLDIEEKEFEVDAQLKIEELQLKHTNTAF